VKNLFPYMSGYLESCAFISRLAFGEGEARDESATLSVGTQCNVSLE